MTRRHRPIAVLAYLLCAAHLAGCIDEDRTRPYAEFLAEYEALQGNPPSDTNGPQPDAGGDDVGDVGEPQLPAPTQCSVDGAAASVTFTNASSATADVIWITHACGRLNYGSLDAGESRVYETFVGHVWQLIAGNTVVGEHVVTQDGETLTFP